MSTIGDKIGKGIGTAADATIDAGKGILNWTKARVTKVLDERQAKREAMEKLQKEILREQVKEALKDLRVTLTPEQEIEIIEAASTEAVKACRDEIAEELHKKIQAHKATVHQNLNAGQLARAKEIEARQAEFYAKRDKQQRDARNKDYAKKATKS